MLLQKITLTSAFYLIENLGIISFIGKEKEMVKVGLITNLIQLTRWTVKYAKYSLLKLVQEFKGNALNGNKVLVQNYENTVHKILIFG